MPNNLIRPTRQLGELAEVVTKGTTPTTLGHDYVGAGIPFIRANNLVGAYVDPAKDVLFIDETTDDLLKRSRILPGDVLLSIAGTIGRASRVPEHSPAMNCNQAVCIIRCTSEIDGDFLRYWLESQNAKAQIATSKVTGVISNLSLAEVKSLEIPLPPITEQRRIVAILDKADALRSKRREAIAKLDQLLQSVFLEMFGDPVTNPKGWRVSTIGDECKLSSGSTPSRQVEAHFDGDIPWVKSTEVNWGLVVETSEHVSEMGQKAARLKVYPLDTVVVALYGQGTTRGKCAILGVPATMNQACAGIYPSAALSSMYLFHYLKGSYLRLRGESRGGSQENLNLGILNSFVLPVPPLELQQKFSRFAQCLKKEHEKYVRSAVRIDQLFRSFQSQVFL